MKIAIVAILVAFSVWVSFVGVLGVIRMPDVYLRIQASAKSVVLGAVPLLIAIVVTAGWHTAIAARCFLVGVLLIVMNPLASHAVARAAYKAGVPMWPGSVEDQVARRRDGRDVLGR